jgi:cation diffusion facilitator CzcD-associated flavoprotein CzcO
MLIQTTPDADTAETDGTRALAAQARAELGMLGYPDRPWVKPTLVDGKPVLDVLVVGGGQTALGLTHGLRRSGVPNVVALDARPAGHEGVWEHFARMPELRTTKALNGLDFGMPSLSARLWFEARHGPGAWETITRIPRRDWMAYLRWFRATTGAPIENNVEVLDIRAGPQPGIVAVETSQGTRLTRFVVLGTGFEGASRLRIPDVVSSALPPDRYDHACDRIDFTKHTGKRIGILGHGASAFDSGVVALECGAVSVDLCFRRPVLPTVNPHKHLEYAGIMAHWSALSDPIRWNIARHFRAVDQPPGVASYEAAMQLPDFHLHAGSPWTDVRLEGDVIRVTTPHQVFEFDHLVCATGYQLDLNARPELRHIAGKVVLWRERYQPPAAEANADLGEFPYLGPAYELIPRSADDEWISRVYAFNFAAFVSCGPHSTAISGHRHALPRVMRSMTRRMMVEQEEHVLAALRAYADPDITLPVGV